jgi:glycosyltransferase involved in cell wall biosynthesis
LQLRIALKNTHLGKLLIIAFHFPPQAGSSGLLRTLKYCRYLPESGWQATVLTLNSRAYEKIDGRSLDSIPKNVAVIRSFALDTKKHMGIGGRYLRYLALPDRWVSWILSAVPSGKRAIREHHIDVLYSTFPIMSAAVIGLLLRRWTNLPWVLDLRDPMSDVDYPRDPLIRWVWRSIERRCMRQASRVIVTTEATRKKYLDRYPGLLTPEKCILISNGYDEEDFRDLRIRPVAPIQERRPIRLVHSGLLYPVERDPQPLFRALSHMKRRGLVSAATLRIVFRAPGTEDLYRRLLRENHIDDLVVLEPHAPYLEALKECAESDGLLLFQAADFDLQIPAKAYEYLRLGKPIFALTTQTGDTAALLRKAGGATIVDLASEYDIYQGLSEFLEAVRAGTHPLPDKGNIRRYARQAQAGQLAKVLDGLKASEPRWESEKTEKVAK